MTRFLLTFLSLLAFAAGCGSSPGDLRDGAAMNGGGSGGASGSGGGTGGGGGSATGGGGDTGNGGAGGCVPRAECGGYAAAMAAAPRGATSIDNCMIQLHQLDCCGRRAAYGLNHGAREMLCSAEVSCVGSYRPAGGCSDGAIVTDTGETTMSSSDVRLRMVNPMPCSFDRNVTCYTCETFVCTSAPCRSAPGITGGCGP